METLVSVVSYLFLFVIIIILFIANSEHKRKLKEVKEVLRHKEEFIKSEIKILEANGEYFVDGDAKPLKIKGYSAIIHHRNGFWRFDPQKIGHFASENNISGKEVYRLLEKNSINGNLIDFLLDREQLIPENWPVAIHCFGTIYSRNEDGLLFIRVLLKCDNRYTSCMCLLKNDFRPEEILIFNA
jgi:hypothetical protein